MSGEFHANWEAFRVIFRAPWRPRSGPPQEGCGGTLPERKLLIWRIHERTLTMRTCLILGASLSAFLIAGCGGGGGADGPPPAGDGPPPASGSTGGGGATAAKGALGTATVTVTLKWKGEVPERVPVQMSEKVCADHAKDNPVLDETVIVNANNTLANVFVWVKKGAKGSYDAPGTPAKLTQKWCQYVPHVLGVQTGQQMEIRNDDGVLHNVHTFAKRNDNNLNLGQPPNTADNHSFAEREVVVPFKCDVHGWMSAYVAVVPHPFFGVSGGDGTVALAKLPAGTYTVEAWHELYGTKELEVTVGDGEAKTLEFTFEDE